MEHWYKTPLSSCIKKDINQKDCLGGPGAWPLGKNRILNANLCNLVPSGKLLNSFKYRKKHADGAGVWEEIVGAH